VRSRDESAQTLFNEYSAGTVAVERSPHDGLLMDLGGAPEEAEASPTTLAYAGFLLNTTALNDYPEALGAVLPGCWIYREVGKVLVERSSPDHFYQEWIETCASEEFGPFVEAVLDLTDRAKASTPPRSPASWRPSSPAAATSGCSSTPPGGLKPGP
jgi:thiaminase